MKELFPLGSVVSIKSYDKRVMIYGRLQRNLSNGELYDYVACDYPLGIVDSMKGILFNNEAIEKVFFIGFQDVEELNYRNALSAYLKEI